MKVAGKDITMSGETYRALRAEILDGTIAPGGKVRIQDMCQRFGVSAGAVRESLSQLMAEGLVFAEAHRGYTIAPLSVEDLLDLTSVRVEIETLCLIRSIQAGQVHWESEVIAALHRLTNTTYGVNNEARTAAHKEFHAALVSECGSPRFLQFRQQLYDSSERYQKLEAVIQKDRRPDEEHKRLAEASIKRDIPLATKLLRAHIELTTQNIVKSMQKKVKRDVRAKKASR